MFAILDGAIKVAVPSKNLIVIALVKRFAKKGVKRI